MHNQITSGGEFYWMCIDFMQIHVNFTNTHPMRI